MVLPAAILFALESQAAEDRCLSHCHSIDQWLAKERLGATHGSYRRVGTLPYSSSTQPQRLPLVTSFLRC